MSGTSSERMGKRNNSKKETRLSRMGKREEIIDVGGVSDGLIGAAVKAVTQEGSAIMFGLTQDGGAFCITLLEDGDRRKEYLHGNEEIEQYLSGIAELYGN